MWEAVAQNLETRIQEKRKRKQEIYFHRCLFPQLFISSINERSTPLPYQSGQ